MLECVITWILSCVDILARLFFFSMNILLLKHIIIKTLFTLMLCKATPNVEFVLMLLTVNK